MNRKTGRPATDRACGVRIGLATGSSAELRPLLRAIRLISEEAADRGLVLTELLLEAAAESVDEILCGRAPE